MIILHVLLSAGSMNRMSHGAQTVLCSTCWVMRQNLFMGMCVRDSVRGGVSLVRELRSSSTYFISQHHDRLREHLNPPDAHPARASGQAAIP